MRLIIILSLITFFAFFEINAQVDLSTFEYRSLGPTRGGRVTAVTGVASQPNVFYFGSTGGGVWKTTDYGTTWNNISDGYFETPSIGAIRVAQNDPNIIYVGTGTDGLRSNIITGKGVYKSVDAGESWKHVGLKKVGQIGAVEIHPTNHNIAFVAAIGQAFNDNPERGVFRTKDGGKTWKKVLFISDKTGFVDLEFMPSNPDIIYASAWHAQRKPWTIISGGEENGIYKSIDGGDTWTKLTNGLPSGIVGKIDLAVTPADSKVVYALIEAPDGKNGVYRSNDQGETWSHISDKFQLTQRAFYYVNIEVDPTDADIVYAPVQSNYKSTDGGKTWGFLRTPHGDNHDIWINPNNPKLQIQANDGGVNITHNGGKTWSTQLNQGTAELYQVEVDDQYPYWLYGGQQDNYTTISVPSLPPYAHQAGAMGLVVNTGGCETGPAVPKPGNPNIVYANCKGKFSVYNKTTGQEQHYYVGGQYIYGHNPKNLNFRFQRVAPIHVSPYDPNVIYHASQYLHKTTDEGKTWEIISPDLTAFEADKQMISGSPITRDVTGEEYYSTIYSIQESKVKQGVIWIGANDGPVHVTKDGGKNWSNVTPKSLPKGGRVDAVEPSPHDPATAYIAVLRYQLGDFKPYIYKTKNYGKSWKLLTNGNNGIPSDYPTRVVREDTKRKGLLYAGTEFGLYISFDDGKNWSKFQQNLPVTPITDIKVHREDLVLSTMGRGFWIVDNLTPLHQQYDKQDTSKVTFFKPKNTIRYRYGRGFGDYPQPAVELDYFLPAASKTPLQLLIYDNQGKNIQTYISTKRAAQKENKPNEVANMSTGELYYTYNPRLKNKKGLNRFRWDFRHRGAWAKSLGRRYKRGPHVAPDVYTAVLIAGKDTLKQPFTIQIDPKVLKSGITETDLQAQTDLNLKIVDLLSDANRLAGKVQKELKKLKATKKASINTDRKTLLEKTEKALVRAKGHYTKPMLISQIQYLYGMLNRGDQRPGKDAYERYEVLKKEFDILNNDSDSYRD